MRKTRRWRKADEAEYAGYYEPAQHCHIQYIKLDIYIGINEEKSLWSAIIVYKTSLLPSEQMIEVCSKISKVDKLNRYEKITQTLFRKAVETMLDTIKKSWQNIEWGEIRWNCNRKFKYSFFRYVDPLQDKFQARAEYLLDHPDEIRTNSI